MEAHSGLGIYIGKQSALALRLRKGKVVARVAVDADAGDNGALAALTRRLAEACDAENLRAAEAVVALDASLFMQHGVHSAFTTAKQISQTIRFDTEEVVAADIGTMAVGFDVVGRQAQGSELNVFTAENQVLSDVILPLQAFGIDPTMIVPDVACLARGIPLWATQPSLEMGGHLIAVLSRRNGYFLRAGDGAHVTPVRAFSLGKAKSNTALLSREAFATLAALRGDAPSRLLVFDARGGVETDTLAARLGIEVQEIDWLRQGAFSAALTEEEDPVAEAIAYGVALFAEDRYHTLNFRNDFMPHQGKRLRMESALKWVCISTTILLLALGGRLQAKWYGKRSDIEQVKAKLRPSYAKVMLAKDLPANPTQNLGREKRKLEAQKLGHISLGDQTTSARLQLILRAINNCYTTAGLEIDYVSIATGITIRGSARDSRGRLTFLSELEKAGLGKPVSKFPPADRGRPDFSITIQPNKTNPIPKEKAAG